jgi:hypothetical protein
VIFRLAEIERAEQFGQADDLRAALRRLFDEGESFVQVRSRLRGAAHLHKADGDNIPGRSHLKNALEP